MIEAMACGTPVMAFDRGSVPEVLQHGKTGLVVHSTEEATKSLPNLFALDRRVIRHEFENRFSVNRMAHDHVALYQKLLKSRDRISFHKRSPTLVENLAVIN